MTNKSKKKLIKATLIVNPVSGKGDTTNRRKIITELATNLGWYGDYVETTRYLSAFQVAKKEASKGTKHIIVCGGDGTIREVLQAVTNKKIAVGIVPLGTGNLLAKNLSLPLDVEEALKVALVGNHKPIDVGVANGEYFSIIAGIGLDAEIMHSAKRELKDRFGLLAYVMVALRKLNNRSGKYEITLDKKKPFVVKAKTIMASNMGKLTSGIEVVPSTDPQSGSLQLGVIKAQSLSSWINIVIHALLGTADNSPHYDVYEAKNIEITSLSGAKRYECDGDHFPKTDHLNITLYPKAVIVMVKADELGTNKDKGKSVMIFDFDGTLANSIEMFMTVYNILAKRHNFPLVTEKKRSELQGMSAKDVIAQLPISKWRLPFIFREGKKEFEKNFEFIKPFDELEKVLPQLSQRYTLGIVTSNDPANVKKFLIKHKLDYFDFVYSDGSLFGKGKVIKDLLHKYNYSPEDVMYVGDEVRDIDAAKSAGIKIVSVSWGFNSKQILIEHNPDYLIDSPSQLSSRDFFS